MSKLDDVLTALEGIATMIAELEGVPQWVIGAGLQIVALLKRLLTTHDPHALDDLIDTASEIGKAALDAEKFGDG